MDRRPHSAAPPPTGRVSLTLRGPIGDLAAALRTFADALDREQARGAVTHVATVEADAPDPAPGGMTAALAEKFVSQLISAAVDVLALLCHNAPRLTYEDLQTQAQAQLGISRTQIGGVLTSLAAGRSGCPGRWTTRSNATRSIDATGLSLSLPSCCCPLSTAPEAPGQPEDGAEPMGSPVVRSEVYRGWT
jgi:hypothetical protein